MVSKWLGKLRVGNGMVGTVVPPVHSILNVTRQVGHIPPVKEIDATWSAVTDIEASWAC